MVRDPTDRLSRLRRHALRGLAEARLDAERAERAVRWLADHPSAIPAVDALWRDAVHGRGPLVAWADNGGALDAWTHDTLPLHTVLAGHPFPDLDLWSIQPTFPAS